MCRLIRICISAGRRQRQSVDSIFPGLSVHTTSILGHPPRFQHHCNTQHNYNCASHYPANELPAHENIFRIYHRTLQPPATAQSRFTLQLPSPYHPNKSPVRPPPLFNSRTYASTAHPAVLYTHQNTKIQCKWAVARRASHHRKESTRGDKTK